MYLVDQDIRSLLPQLNIETDNKEHPFLADEQIQPCSIDLRLSNVFWVPTGRTTIDLRRSHLLEISPRRYWKKVILKPNECITLKPGQLLLGRTYEKFTIPIECAGKIEGRSSFARMGLAIHCTGDLIIPNWRGHMTMQLVNFGPYPIKIFPYLPICQLILVRLSGQPTHLYGAPHLQSKYMEDDGGPSYWWRDKLIKRLQKRLSETDLTLGVHNDLLASLGQQEPEILERIEQFIAKLSVSQLENAEGILDAFGESEDRRRFRHQLLKLVMAALFPTLLSFSIGSLFQNSYGLWHVVLWITTGLSLPITLYSIFQADFGQYLGKKELRRLRQQAQPIKAQPD